MGDVVTLEEELNNAESFFTLETGRPALVGRSERPVEGYVAYKIADLEKNDKISRYAVQLDLRPDGRVIISRPKLNLGKDEPEYVSKNIIAVRDVNGKTIEIYRDRDSEYDAGIGGRKVQSLFVGDRRAENCFSLSIGANNQVRLEAITANGKDL